MTDKLKLLPQDSWDEKERLWDERAKELSSTHPIKKILSLPNIPGITKKTARFLKAKALKYLLLHDKGQVFIRYFFKHPIKYGYRLLKSYLKGKSYTRENDFFFYSIADEQTLTHLYQNTDSHLVIGFSYCHKPFECPSGRFSDQCKNDPSHPVCGQCFIGKASQLAPAQRTTLLFIPTIHYIGEKMFALREKHPKKNLLFIITACEMTLEMFGDWGLMVGAQGIGVRLDGRICNTMDAFSLSEEGIKPGLTVVTSPSQKRILSIFKSLPTEQAEN